MVSIHVFDIDAKSQTLRTLLALTVLAIGDLFYLFLTQNSKKLWNNKLAYLILWIIIGLFIGVTVLRDESGEYDYNNARSENVYYGILLGLIIYIPLNSWLSSVGYITVLQALYYISYGIFLTAVTSLITFMVSTSSELINIHGSN